MLRVHFTVDDLARTRLLPTVDPLWEVVLSQFLLHERLKPVYLQPWAQLLVQDPERVRRAARGVRMLAGLAPQGPYFPDFLTPAEAGEGLEAGLEAIARTPRRRLLTELNLLAECSRSRQRRIPSWLTSFAAADRPALTHLTAVLRDYHQAAIAPHNELIKASVDADVAFRISALLCGGIEGLFGSFGSFMTWKAPILEVRYDVDQELHLHGRGLRLVPSFFCHGSAVSVADPELVPVVIYPIDQQHRWPVVITAPNRNALAKLLGATRATVLQTIDAGASTTDLALALSTSPSSVSRHTTALREAGLITTQRRGPAVQHAVTPLGRSLLKYVSSGHKR